MINKHKEETMTNARLSNNHLEALKKLNLEPGDLAGVSKQIGVFERIPFEQRKSDCPLFNLYFEQNVINYLTRLRGNANTRT